MDYLLHIITIFAIYAALAISLDLVVGQTGLLSVCHAAFYGIGAYVSAGLAIRTGASFPLALLAGGATAAVCSLLVSVPSLRLHDDYFVLATLGFQMVVFDVLNNWSDVTRGPMGLVGIPQPELFGWAVRTHGEYAFVALGLSGIVLAVVWLLSNSPYGRVLRAIREDEAYALSMGKNVLRFKVTAFAVSAGLAGMAGSMYAHYVTYVDPTSFTVTESILVISMVVIGGAGKIRAVVAGTAFLIALPEALRFAGVPDSMAGQVRQIIYGGLLVAVMMARSAGTVRVFASKMANESRGK